MKKMKTTTKEDYEKIICKLCTNCNQCNHDKIIINNFNNPVTKTKDLKCLEYDYINKIF